MRNGSRTRPRVLLLAYACRPDSGSEPGTGWHRALELAKSFDTWVLYEKNEFEGPIRRYLAEHGEIRGLRFRPVAKSRVERLLGDLPGLYYAAYNLWHRRAYRAAVELHRDVRFDLVHQANMCGFREPGYLWQLDAPFVWGPIGGTQNYPGRFLGHAGLHGAIRESIRTLVNRLQLRLSTRVRRAARRAAISMAANTLNQRDLERAHGVSPVLFLDIGIESVVDRPRRPNGDGTLRLLWSGEFKHHKALQLLIAALGRLPDSFPYELRILGDGPLEQRWRRLARRHGIAARCRWMGWLPRREAMRQYDWADLFVFTSLRDTAGTVVLEALSRGVPVVCLDHQGAGDIVTDECGAKIRVSTPERTVRDLHDVIAALGRDRDRRARLSHGAVARAREFLWSRQGERLTRLYEQVLAGGRRDESRPRTGSKAAHPSA